MIKNSIAGICLWLLSITFLVHGMEDLLQEEKESVASQNLKKASRYVDFVKFFILTDEYVDAREKLIRAEDDPVVVYLVISDQEIDQWCDEHTAILLAMRDLVIIQKKMDPWHFFLRNTGGRCMDADVMNYLLKQFAIDDVLTLRSLVLLIHKLQLLKTGKDFFALHQDTSIHPSGIIPLKKTR